MHVLSEVAGEIFGGVVGWATFAVLTVSHDPTAVEWQYYFTKAMDMMFSGMAAMLGYLIVYIAKKKITTGKNNVLRRIVKWFIKK
jgi:hypothetical protein